MRALVLARRYLHTRMSQNPLSYGITYQVRSARAVQRGAAQVQQITRG